MSTVDLYLQDTWTLCLCLAVEFFPFFSSFHDLSVTQYGAFLSHQNDKQKRERERDHACNCNIRRKLFCVVICDNITQAGRHHS